VEAAVLDAGGRVEDVAEEVKRELARGWSGV
jgi:hypothetical protein